MKRHDRLEALRVLLRSVEATTVEALAEALGVTARTVHRDLASLRDRGTPVEGRTGRGGGVRLLGDRGITGVHLTIAEVVSLWLAARLAGEAARLPWSATMRSALQKLLAALPRTRAAELRQVLTRVVVGPPPSAAMVSSMSEPAPDVLTTVEQSITAGCGCAFDYVDRNGRRSTRRVEVHGLFVQTPLWYILVRDRDTGHARMMRMDRIRAPRLQRAHSFVADRGVIDELVDKVPGRSRSLAADLVTTRVPAMTPVR